MTQSIHDYAQLNPLIPPAPAVSTWTRFIFQFEPYEFTGWVDESKSWKETAYIGDWSPLPNKIVVKGPDAVRFFQDISVNSFASFVPGQAKHCIQCADDGKVMCEGVLMHLGPEEVKFTSGPIYWAGYQFEKGRYDAEFTQHGHDHFIIQIQGPAAIHILEKASGERQRDYGFMRLRKTQVAGIPVWSVRQGMSGELGFELHGEARHAQQVHQALLEAGAAFNVRRLGGRTKMVNHAEACFPTPVVDFMPALRSDAGFMEYLQARHPDALMMLHMPTAGSEPITDQRQLYRDPTEMGWIKNIKFDHDFIGRSALERVVAAPKRKMVTLLWHPEDVTDVFASLFRGEEPYDVMELPRALMDRFIIDRVLKDDKPVGVATSRCYSYHFRKMISLCSIDLAHAEPGEEVVVLWGAEGGRQKRIRATVAPAPYKQDNRKVDVDALPCYL